MRYGDQSEDDVSNTSQAERPTSGGSHLSAVESIKHAASPSSPPRRVSQDSSGRGSRSPVTPGVNPSSRPTRKRTASQIDQEDRDHESTNPAFSENRRESEDSVLHVCICQPDPKIPRPRNAFILYRQHHQAAVVAQNPGLANPEISKIIGEQWQNQSAEVKNKWKALAEEEKIRHQQQHPTYRYQPKRSGRRNSLTSEGSSSTGSKSICPKCGGHTNLASVQPSPEKITSAPGSASGPLTPSSAITPVSRTLPTLKELSLQSPSARPQDQMAGGHPSTEDRDAIGSLSPGSKRRRFNDAPLFTRVMPTRYAVAPPLAGIPVGPGTLYPVAQQSPHPYPLAISHERRDSLPSIRGVMTPPAAMAPPPRPGMGYQQHRLSQGHHVHDRSLTLPPLQSGKAEAASSSQSLEKSVREQIMGMDFRYKIKILNQVAPPEPISSTRLRGPLIAVEGDNEECANQVGAWLHEEIGKGNDRRVSLLDSPVVSTSGPKKTIMAAYHRLIADWLEKSSEMHDSLLMNIAHRHRDSTMADTGGGGGAPPAPRSSAIDPDEPSDRRDTPPDRSRLPDQSIPSDPATTTATATAPSSSRPTSSPETPAVPRRSPVSATTFEALKPIALITNYSLHASNSFACSIPITAPDPYSPSDHWQWTATQWRGVISPDLTIYVKDVSVGDAGILPAVEFVEEGGVCVLRRVGREGPEVEGSSLRRLGFEVSEWVRAFGTKGI